MKETDYINKYIMHEIVIGMYKRLESAMQAELQVAKKFLGICIAIRSLQNEQGD